MPAENKLLENPGALCNMVRRIAVEAGEIILKYYEMDGDIRFDEKADGSPVSQADREAEELIEKKLKALIPGIPVIGEEAAAAGRLPDLKGRSYFWLADPLDGTKEFISGGADFTVNIALIHERRPLLGVVYVPVSGVVYAGFGPGKAFRRSEETGRDRPINVRKPPARGLTVVASRNHGDAARLDKFLEGFKVEKMIKRGSSLKICAIAEGKADLYPRFGPTCEWDTAAAHAVLASAGGHITDISGKPLSYGGGDTKFLNPEFVAASFAWFEGEAP